MTNKKISELASATTPLSGSELVPIVQNATTVNVSINNLTAGKAVPAQQVNVTSSNTAELHLICTGQQEYILGSTGTSYGDAGKLIVYLIGVGELSQYNTSGDFKLQKGNVIPGTAGKGINFTANSPASGMTSQNLTWYEEGTFTPSDVSGASLSFTNQSGYYTRIGRVVTCQVQFQYPTTANGSQARISLPFTAKNDTNCGGGVFYVNTPGTGLTGCQPNVVGNQSYFILSNVAGGVAYLNLNASGNYFRGTITYIV